MRSSLPPFPPIDCSFCPKKRRGPSRFICRFNNRGSLCATLFEWLIRCLQPSGPTHNAARGNFATPSTFHSPLATLLLQHRLPSFYTLQSSFPVHPCVPRFVDVANFSPSLILPLRVASFRYFHVGHAIIFHSAASPSSVIPRVDSSPRKFSTRISARFAFFTFSRR